MTNRIIVWAWTPVLDAKTLSDQTSGAGSFRGVAAMGLSAMGLYGGVSCAAKQSTHEIGIRLALGATRRDVVRRFLGRGLRLGTMPLLESAHPTP